MKFAWEDTSPARPSPAPGIVGHGRAGLQHKAASADFDLSGPVELVALSVKGNASRCRILGSGRVVALRASEPWEVVPREIVVVRPRKQWTYAGHPCLSGEIGSTRLDSWMARTCGMLPPPRARQPASTAAPDRTGSGAAGCGGGWIPTTPSRSGSPHRGCPRTACGSAGRGTPIATPPRRRRARAAQGARATPDRAWQRGRTTPAMGAAFAPRPCLRPGAAPSFIRVMQLAASGVGTVGRRDGYAAATFLRRRDL